MNEQQLPEALALLPVGLHVVTAFAEGRPAGLLCGWVTQVSWTPPLVAAAIGVSKHTHDAVADSEAFCVNLLSTDQLEVAVRFGTKSGRDADKFVTCSWRAGETGSPILDGIAGFLDCRVVAQQVAGDHTLFIGEIVDAQADAQACLVYDRRQHQQRFAA